MRYTKWDKDEGRYSAPLYYKEDGEQIQILVKSFGRDDEVDRIYGEPIDRLAALENRATPTELRQKEAEFFIQGFLVRETFYHCPQCGLNFGKIDNIRKDEVRTIKYCHKCGQALKWPMKKEAKQ